MIRGLSPSCSPMLLLLSLLSLPYLVSAEIYHVKPPSWTLPCPPPDPDDDHCKTLEDYAAQPPESDIDMTFLFMEGEHPLSRDFSLSNISSVSLVSLTYQEDSGVNCSDNGKFVFENVENVIFSNLSMLGCYGNQIVDATSFSLDSAHIEGLPSSNYSPPAFLVERVSIFNVLDSEFSSNEAVQNISDACSVFSVGSSNVRIANSEFSNNSASSVGDQYPIASPICVYSSNVSIESSNFTNNIGLTGGALYAIGNTTVVVSQTTFTNNSAGRAGGALCLNPGSSLLLDDCVLRENSCFLEGGAIYMWEADKIQAKHSSFLHNHALSDPWNVGKGGVLWIRKTLAVFENCIFLGNKANMTGTIHASEDSDVSIKSCNFSRNNAHLTKPDQGAGPSALAVYESRLELVECTLDQNSPLIPFEKSTTVYIRNSHVTISDSSFTNNTGNLGGIMWAEDRSDIAIGNGTIFANNIATHFGGVFYVDSGTLLSLDGTSFTANEADTEGGVETEGGVIYAYKAQVKATNVSFLHSRAQSTGVVWLSISNGSFSDCSFIGNSATLKDSGSISAVYGSVVDISSCYFADNEALGNGQDLNGGAGATMNVDNSSVHIADSVFTSNSANTGGCGYVSHDSNLYITGNTVFQHNRAKYGGVFTIRTGSQIHINTDLGQMCDKENMVNFIANYAEFGGALNIIENSKAFIHCANFENNRACNRRQGFENCGEIDSTEVPYHRGGAILARTNSKVNLTNTVFTGNNATEKGGMLFAQFSEIATAGYLDIQHNDGGMAVVYLTNCTATITGRFSFVDNYQSFFIRNSEITFAGERASFERQTSRRRDNTDLMAEGRALTAFRSTIFMHSDMVFENNRCVTGSAMYLTEVPIEIYGNCSFVNNSVTEDGAVIDAYRSTITFFKGTTIFENNTAGRNGGAIFLGRSTIHYNSGLLSFSQNFAMRGGAIYFELASSLYINKEILECETAEKKWFCQNDSSDWLQISFSENYADKGGALYVNDSSAPSCSSVQQTPTDYFHDECFIQSLAIYDSAEDWNATSVNPHLNNINFDNNMANHSGAILYGGLLDRCKPDNYSEIVQIEGATTDGLDYFRKISGITDLKEGDIASDPLRVCLCDEDDEVDCNMTMPNFSFVPGRMFNDLKLAVVDQTGAPFNKSLSISASLSSESSRLKDGQSKQTLAQMCSKLNFTPYSEDFVTLTLYVTKSPCTDGISKLVIPLNLNLESECPVGFALSNTSLGCECDSKLSDYVTNCDIQNSSLQRRDNVWISVSGVNDANETDILVHDYCPYDYCRPPSENLDIWINLSDPSGSDAQCAFNRTGELCGCCKDGYSLTLGGSECRQCTNAWLVLIIPIALAGIALVLVMMVCNLTLATGTINGPLFYANILIANRFVFFPQHKLSIPLQVLVSMLGLNLGITTCFYDGLDGLGKIFLQIAFEAYLIFLVVIVILMGRSVRVSNFFHKYNFHPLHTLATLIILSYEKLSRKIFSLFAHTSLHYAYNNTATDSIWLFYPCEGSLVWRQVILYIIGAVIIAAGFALNFILLFNKCIVGKCRSVYFNTFMVAFNAPFKPTHQYWVGLLLLIRNISYIVCEAFNAGKNPTDSLHFIFTLIIGLLLLKFFYAGMPSLKLALTSFKKLISRRHELAFEPLYNPVEERSGIVYKNPYIDFLETSFLINLLLLTYFTLYFREDVVKNQNNQAILFIISSAVVLITFIGILVYHTWVYTGVFRLCRKRQGDNNETQPRLIEEDERISLHKSNNAYGTNIAVPTYSEVDTKSI